MILRSKNSVVEFKFNKMKTKILIIPGFVFLISTAGFPQELNKKELREERKIEKQKQTDSLLDSKTFVFNAARALSQSGKSIDLTTNSGFVTFDSVLITSDLPFFGRAYSGVEYGGDAGMKFSGKPKDYTITKGNKNYEIKAEVTGSNDYYQLFLTVSFDGSASLTINSNNRSSILYNGDISKLQSRK